MFNKYNSDQFLGQMDVEEFLGNMVTNQTATVSASELRNLLQEKRKLARENKQLRNKLEMLQLRNVSLKQELTEVVCNQANQLMVTGIDGIDIKA